VILFQSDAEQTFLTFFFKKKSQSRNESMLCGRERLHREHTHTHTHTHTHRKLSVTVGRVDVVAIDYGELADA